MSWLPELKAIKADETHELNQKVTEIFPSNEKLELIQDIQEFSDEMIVFVDFFESNQNYQVLLTRWPVRDRWHVRRPVLKLSFSVLMF